MKKLIYFITTILACGGLAFAQAVVPAFAVDTLGGQKIVNTTNRLENRVENQASKSANRSANQLQTIIQKADTLITNRLDSLNTTSNRIQSDTRLSANEKSSLTANIQQEVSGLMALKAKIDADTDATTARTDAKQIITNYYIYEVFEPKVRLLITLNNMETTLGYVQALVPQLQNLINTLKSQGKDVSQLQPLLDDVSTQLTTIDTTIGTDITTVQNVSVSNNTTAKATFSKVRQDISQVIKGGYAKIRSDFSQMRPLFKTAIGVGGTTKVTPTVAPSGTAVSPTTESPSTSPAPSQ